MMKIRAITQRVWLGLLALAVLGCVGFFAVSKSFVQAGVQAFATPWQGEGYSKVRLIVGEGHWFGKKGLVAGIEIQLAPKWKTYWRMPGDAGIPPSFDFSRSKNLQKAEVLYPLPQRYFDPNGLTIGYKERVVFPVLLLPVEPGQSIELRVSASFGICKDLCIPVEAKFDLSVGQARGSPFSSLLDLSLNTVPQPLKSSPSLGVERVELVKGQQPFLTVSVKTERKVSDVELFLEGPGGLYVPTPKRVEMTDDQDPLKVVFQVDLGDEDVADFEKAALVCTVKIDDQAFVQSCPVK